VNSLAFLNLIKVLRPELFFPYLKDLIEKELGNLVQEQQISLFETF
jgi:hypothetical protein